MNQSLPQPLTYTEIQAIEARAHQLRAEAMAEFLKALGRGLRTLPQKLSTRLHLPRHA